MYLFTVPSSQTPLDDLKILFPSEKTFRKYVEETLGLQLKDKTEQLQDSFNQQLLDMIKGRYTRVTKDAPKNWEALRTILTQFIGAKTESTENTAYAQYVLAKCYIAGRAAPGNDSEAEVKRLEAEAAERRKRIEYLKKPEERRNHQADPPPPYPGPGAGTGASNA